MSPIPTKVVVDCAVWGAQHLIVEADAWQVKADSARSGDAAFAARCDEQAIRLRDQARAALTDAGHDPDAPPPVETYRPLTPQEQEQRKRDEAEAPARALADVRATRNALLAASDWTQLPGSPLTASQKEAWDGYRQTLRDLTATVEPLNPIWPDPPAFA